MEARPLDTMGTVTPKYEMTGIQFQRARAVYTRGRTAVIKDTETDDARVENPRKTIKEMSESYGERERVVVSIIKCENRWYIKGLNKRPGGSWVCGCVR